MKRRLHDEEHIAALDRALSAAEEVLRELLPAVKRPDVIASDFAIHVRTHLRDELTNIQAHGHRNDDPNDKPIDVLGAMHDQYLDDKKRPD